MTTLTETTCCTGLGCKAAIPDGDTLCNECINDLEQALTDLPGLAHALEAAYLHQQQFSVAGIGIPNPDEASLPYDDQAGRARRELTRTLLRWWLRVSEEADHQPYAHPMSTPATVEQMSEYLLWHVDWFAGHPDGGQALADFRRIVKRAESACDRPPDLLYLGICSMPVTVTDGGVEQTVECPRDLYGVVGQAHARCPLCKHQHDIVNRQAVLLNSVRDQLASAADIARGLSGLGVTVTADRIRQWKSRGRLVARGTEARPTYVVGEVLDLVQADLERTRKELRNPKPGKADPA